MSDPLSDPFEAEELEAAETLVSTLFPDGIPLTEDGHVPYFVTSMLMGSFGPEEDGFDWDQWKDDMKDASMRDLDW